MVRLLGNSDLRRQLGAAGRVYVETHHDWERCLEPFGPLLGLPAAPDPSEAALSAGTAS